MARQPQHPAIRAPRPRQLPDLPPLSLYLRGDRQGAHWIETYYEDGKKLTALRQDVAEWCFNHLGPVILKRSFETWFDVGRDHYKYGHPYLMFRSDTDALVFKMHWGSL